MYKRVSQKPSFTVSRINQNPKKKGHDHQVWKKNKHIPIAIYNSKWQNPSKESGAMQEDGDDWRWSASLVY